MPRKAMLWTTVGLAAMAAVTACRPDPSFLAGRRECPHTWIGIAGDSLHLVLTGNVDLVAPIINVPEFHDCQRFIVDSAGVLVYQDFYAIWSSWRLDSLRSDFFRGVAPGGPDPIGAQAQPGATGPQQVSTTLAVPIAEIYAEGAYDPLGIKPWLNCLFLWIDVGQFKARMVPMGYQRVKCEPVTPNTLKTGTDLQVRRTSTVGFAEDGEYPPVARWDWDSTNAKQYIGVKCGVAWCEIGEQNFRSSVPLAVSATDPRGIQRVRLIKGYYDQQLLAPPPRAGKKVPTSIVGTVVPDTLLGSHNDPMTFTNKLVHVGDVALESTNPVADAAALAAYASQLNFVQAPIGAPNRVSLCQDVTGTPPGSCITSSTGLAVTALPVSTATATTCTWWAVVERAGTTPPSLGSRCVTRFPAPATISVGTATAPLIIPGTARWRWTKNDEGDWFRCTQGCCEMTW